VSSAVSVLLALVVATSAGSKAWRSERSAQALATYGISPMLRLPILWGLVAIELGLAVALVAETPFAPEAVGTMFLVFAALTAGALLAGRSGQPCACFGSASRLSWSSLVRSLLLAATAGVLASGWLPAAPSSYDRWLTVGLALSLAAIAALFATVLALAREVGVLRLQSTGQGALEIEQEGPSLGDRQAWAAALPSSPRALVKLAVFTSDGCPLCHRVAPAISHVAGDPLVAVGIFHESTDAAVWRQAAAPGSPYAVALDLEGVALAKGTFNSLAQLESIIATARKRERRIAVAA
jgi:hypothetical protein